MLSLTRASATSSAAPMARDGVYLYGYYGQGNIGDDLLLASAVRMIRSVRPAGPIFVHCHDPARFPKLDDPDIIPVAASSHLADASLSKPKRLLAYRTAVRAAFARCDALVFGGGTVFQDAGSPVSLMLIAATVMAAKRQGLKVIAIGSGVGRLRTMAGRIAMRAILRRCDAFCARDEASEAICREIVPDARLRRTADLVYALDGEATARTRRGLLLSIQPAVTSRRDDLGERVRRALTAVIAAAVSAREPCLLLAFETKLEGMHGIDDRSAWAELAEDALASHPGLVRIETLPGAPDEAIAAMAAGRLHVGMRYHGHVLAAIAGTPFAGLAHDVKVAEVCRSFDMPCVDAAKAETEAMRRAATEAGARAVDPAKLAALRADACRNLDVLRVELGGA